METKMKNSPRHSAKKINNAKSPLASAPDIQQETRFAVVMYGGISLAIYIHGAAQELYHMVRATARDINGVYLIPEGELRSTEPVYRKLGEALRTRFVVDILSGTSAGGINAVFLAKALANQSEMDYIKKFWINEGDIASLLNDVGSLKGLSGISLKKPSPGLLNSQRFYYKLLEAMMQMKTEDKDFHSSFVEELDLNITATDIRGLDLPLFITNSNKIIEPRFRNVFQFYYRPAKRGNPNDGRNDFSRVMDPFLAFAARCTASIPPAFEAMQLADISPILKTAAFKGLYGDIKLDETKWRRIYTDYVNEGDDFALRSFGDGGYLDNKPFSYATESLLRRRADLPVDRRLIYIEPSPQHPEDKPHPSEKPDMIENIRAALSLPREETIREDLEKIQQRNAIIRRINHMLESVSFNVLPPENKKRWESNEDWASFYLMDKKVLQRYGSGYIAYHQLLVESVLENLGTAYTRAIGWNEGGEEAQEIHHWMHLWAETKYATERGEGNPSQNNILYRLDLSFRMRRTHFLNDLLNHILLNIENYFLTERSKAAEKKLSKAEEKGLEKLKYIFATSKKRLNSKKNIVPPDSIPNILWLLRRMKEKLNDTYECMKADALVLRRYGLVNEKSGHNDGLIGKYISLLIDVREDLGQWMKLTKLAGQFIDDGVQGADSLMDLIEEAKKDEKEIARLKRLVSDLPIIGQKKNQMMGLIDNVADKQPVNLLEGLSNVLAYPLGEKNKKGGLLTEVMDKARKKDVEIGLREPDDKSEGERSRKGLEDKWRNELTQHICEAHGYDTKSDTEKRKLEAVIKAEADRCFDILHQVQSCLAYYYSHFDFYDMLTFPITYGTDAGEADVVEVIRISPEDAVRLVDEARDGRKKLAGTQLANFGAFFKKEWRENDMLWGRLDTAEILISEMLKGADETAVRRFERSMLNLYEEKNQKDSATLSEEDKRKLGYELAFQGILEEDLRPSDTSFLYKLLVSEEEEIVQPPIKKIKQKEGKDASKELESKTLTTQESWFSWLKPGRIRDGISSIFAKVKRSDPVAFGKILRAEEKDSHRLLEFFRLGYATDPNFEPQSTLRAANRSILVLSDMLNGLSDKYPLSKPSGYLRLFGQAATAVINFAIPKTWVELAFNYYWVWIVYLVAGVLLWASNGIAKVAVSDPKAVVEVGEAIRKFAFQIFAITVAFHTLIAVMHGWMARNSSRIRMIYVGEVILLIVGLVSGLAVLSQLAILLIGVTLALHLPVKLFPTASNPTIKGIFRTIWYVLTMIFKFAGLAFFVVLIYSGLQQMGILDNAPLIDLFIHWIRSLVSPGE